MDSPSTYYEKAKNGDLKELKLNIINEFLNNLLYENIPNEYKEKIPTLVKELKEICVEDQPNFKPNWFSPTGNTIKRIIKEKNITLEELAKKLKWSINTTEDVLEGKHPILPRMAEDLVRILGSTKGFWIRRDKHYWSEKFRIENEL